MPNISKKNQPFSFKNFAFSALNLFFLVPVGYFLIGLVNAGGAYNFLGSFGIPSGLSLALVILLTIIWGAPYYEGIITKIKDMIAKKVYLTQESLNDVNNIVKRLNDSFNPKEPKENYIHLMNNLKFSKIPYSLYEDILHLSKNNKTTESKIEKINQEIKELQYIGKFRTSMLQLNLPLKTDKNKPALEKDETRKIEEIKPSFTLKYLKYLASNTIYGTIKFIGFGNPVINALGTMIGGYAIATAFHLSSTVCLILTIGGGIAGFLGAAFLTKKGVDDLAKTFKESAIEGHVSLKKDPQLKDNLIENKSKSGIICAGLSIYSIVTLAIAATAFPSSLAAAIALTVIANIIIFLAYTRYNKEKGKSFLKAIDKSFVKSATFIAFMTSFAIGMFNMYAGSHALDALFKVLGLPAPHNVILNNILGYSSLIFTIVAAGSFFLINAKNKPSHAHKSMKVGAFLEKIISKISNKNENIIKLQKKIKFRNNLRFAIIYSLAIIPTFFTAIMVRGAVISDLSSVFGNNATQLLGIVIAFSACYLCYRLFTSSVHSILEMFFKATNAKTWSSHTSSDELAKSLANLDIILPKTEKETATFTTAPTSN